MISSLQSWFIKQYVAEHSGWNDAEAIATALWFHFYSDGANDSREL